MTRLDLNDMMMGAYLGALKATGYEQQAENCKKIYEVQRVEMIANESNNLTQNG